AGGRQRRPARPGARPAGHRARGQELRHRGRGLLGRLRRGQPDRGAALEQRVQPGIHGRQRRPGGRADGRDAGARRGPGRRQGRQLRLHRQRRERHRAEPGALPVRLGERDADVLLDEEEGQEMRRTVYAAGAGACAAGAARLAYCVLNRRPPGGPKAWSRTNHRGEPVTLLEGPAVAAGAIAGVLAQGLQAALAAAGSPGSAAWRRPAAMALGGAGAAAFGAYDDLAGSGDRRGFRGHIGALRHGEVTTGAVKLGGIGATGFATAVLAGGSPADVVINAGLVAGGANLLNLFDLRPARAIKVAAAAGALLGAAGQDSVAAPLGAALALLPEDLGERAMLGDAGANALGAMLGASAAGLS